MVTKKNWANHGKTDKDDNNTFALLKYKSIYKRKRQYIDNTNTSQQRKPHAAMYFDKVLSQKKRRKGQGRERWGSKYVLAETDVTGEEEKQ